MASMLGELLRRAVSRPLAAASLDEAGDEAAKAFTVRPSSELRAYLEARAQHLGDLPLSNLVTMILSSVKDADASGQYSDHGYYDEAVDGIGERIRFLYSTHEYSLLEAVTTLEEYGVTPAVFLNNKQLIDKLPMSAFQELAEAFCVRIEWLTDPSKEHRLSERPHNRHNSNAILGMILRSEEAGILKRVVPLCQKNDLDGNRLVYSGDHGRVHASIAAILAPAPRFKHTRVLVWSEIPFDYREARIEYKALLMRLYQKYPGGSVFQGAALEAKVYDRVISGNDVVREKVVDALTGASTWDAEFYVGATWGENPPLEENELGDVREFADQYLAMDETTDPRLARRTVDIPPEEGEQLIAELDRSISE